MTLRANDRMPQRELRAGTVCVTASIMTQMNAATGVMIVKAKSLRAHRANLASVGSVHIAWHICNGEKKDCGYC